MPRKHIFRLCCVGVVGAGLLAWGVLQARPSAGIVRTYYVAAEVTEWDYAPSGEDRISGKPFEGFAEIMMTSAPDRIGRVYRKAVYREYTDSTFTTVKPRPPEWEHLGILGPLLRAVVGDTIRIVFKNLADRPYSMHPHGVFYTKSSEGAPYVDGTGAEDAGDDAVETGEIHEYIWPVPERAGPGPMDGSSAFWMYHSHTNEDADVNAGLMGPIIITARSRAQADATPDDVDRELVLMFGEFDENASWYHEENIRAHADPARVPRDVTFADLYYISNLKETINGFSSGHTPGLVMRERERVRWYVFATTNFEVHAPHWHGQTVLANQMRTDVLSLLTMQMVTANMIPDNPGTWLLHCHVGPHLLAGMAATFQVLPATATMAGR